MNIFPKNGRSVFKKYNTLINFTVYFFKKMPKLFRFFIFLPLHNRSGKLGAIFRYVIYRSNGADFGRNVYLAKYIILKNFDKIKIGENVSIHEFCYIDAAGKIEIGNNVSIAHGCSLISFEHTWEDEDTSIKYNPVKYDSIKIENDVWIGCGVRILSGSNVEERVIVAAGSVVKGTLEGGYIYAGIPAKKIRKITERVTTRS